MASISRMFLSSMSSYQFNGDNSPDPLLILCIKYIVNNDISFNNISLPQEICDLLIEVYRLANINSDLSPEQFTKFINQFRSYNSRVSRAKFSDMPITNDTLELFLEQHSKTIEYLDISNCSNLTPKALKLINKIFTKVCDPTKLNRTLRIYEQGVNYDSKKSLIVNKHYSNGTITTTTNNCTFDECVGIIHDDYILTQTMGAFDDPAFFGFQSKKLREISGLFDPYEEFISQSHSNNQPSPTTSQNFCSHLFSDLNHYKQNESYSIKTSENTIKTIEITTWQHPVLNTLIIGKSTHILPEHIEHIEHDEIDRQYIINPLLPLKKLVIHEWTFFEGSPYLSCIITPTMRTTLQHLDLSNCSSISRGTPLLQLENLKTLILHNCPKLHLALDSIIKIKTLRYLDISTSNERFGHCYKQPNSQLAMIVNNLPNLTHLDISGTNLAGPRCEKSHLPGLISRQSKYLEYLGLYNTANEAAYRHNIPAHSIAGDATEEQIITACEVYIDRIEFLRRALNDLFHCFRFESNFHDVNRSCDVILMCMARHLQDKQIQIAASASLFYIVKSDEAKHNFNIKIKRQIIVCLLDAMQAHRHDTTMLRNGSLTLIHFKIPQDVIFEYTRLVEILLHIVTNDDEDFIQRLGIYLLNSLACQVDGDQKSIVGDLGAIQKMLALIDSRLRRNICDEVMEMAWSTMWNVTDETPINCERFLDNNGMDYFISCMHSFPNSPELLRNIMGLLGNVAECAHLRHKLMKPEYIHRFVDLLDSESDGIEVSYNAAGILSHIASDGEHFWQQYLPSDCKRDEMLSRMRRAISRWKINSKRNINYRSFEPIIRLLKSDQMTSEAQYWAVWALANLTRVYCSKYCPLLEEDNGVEILENLIQSPRSVTHVRNLAILTLFQYKKYQETGNLSGLENSDEIDVSVLTNNNK